MSSISLKPLSGYTPFPGPVVCIVMDGVGIGNRDETDGVHLANTPVLDRLFITDMFTMLKAHGTAVGMPSDADMGNSEVGHNTLGAGRVFAQGAKLVQEAVDSGALFTSKAWEATMQRGKQGKVVHFIGLLSDGNVHSHINHLLAMLDKCGEERIRRVRLHLLLDGRDVEARSALTYLDKLESKLGEMRDQALDYRIASGGGRMVITMDRYFADWPMVERGWKAHVLGEGRQFGSAKEAVQTYYDEDPEVGDQYLGEFVVAVNDKPVGTINDGDAVVLFNFRGDRALEITAAFEQDDFPHFDRVRHPDVFFAGMTEYDGDAQAPKNFLVERPEIQGMLSEYLCAEKITSFATSETQKYGHVTYFWNGNKSGYIDEKLERYVEIPSDNVPFDQRPWMQAAEITDATIDAVRSGQYKFIRLNYPNGDMVGHTGNYAAIRVSVESVDLGLSRLLPAIKEAKGMAVILADHGNADLLYTEQRGKHVPMVAHTLNPVPFIVCDYSGSKQFKLRREGLPKSPGLGNVAATLANLLGFERPDDYDESLVKLRE